MKLHLLHRSAILLLFGFSFVPGALAQSRFTELFCSGRVSGECPDLKGLSLPSLSQKINGDGLPSLATFIPDGRSLQAKHASYANPRVLLAPTLSSPNSGDLLLGFSKEKNELEVISRNPQTGENEFYLVSNFPENPRIEQQHGDTCIRCHASGKPIFSAGPWSETPANPRVAARMCEALGGSNTYEGLPFTADCTKVSEEAKQFPDASSTPSTTAAFAQAFGYGAAVRVAAQRTYNRTLCSQACQNETDPEKAKACQLNILKLAILGGSLNANLPTTPQQPPEALRSYYAEEQKITFAFLKGETPQEQELSKLYKDILQSLNPSAIDHSLISPETATRLSAGRPSTTIADREPRVPEAERSKASPALLKRAGQAQIFRDAKGNEDVTYDDFFADGFADLRQNIRNTAKSNRRTVLPHLQALKAHLFPSEADSKFEAQNPQSDSNLLRATGAVPRDLFAPYLAMNARSCLGATAQNLGALELCLQRKGLQLFEGAALQDLSRIADSNWARLQPPMKEASQGFQDFLKNHCNDPLPPAGQSAPQPNSPHQSMLQNSNR